jgi:hypothetical protein
MINVSAKQRSATAKNESCHISFPSGQFLQMDATLGAAREARVVELPPFDTALHAGAIGWEQFLSENATELEELLLCTAEQPSGQLGSSSMTIVSCGEWPCLVPESRLSRSLQEAARRQATLHYMQQYARANPALVLPTFGVLHMLHASNDCMAHHCKIGSQLTEERSTSVCSCDDTDNGVRGFDALAYILRRLLSTSAATSIPPQNEADLWASVWSSGYYRLLSAFFASHGDWSLIGRLQLDTARKYIDTLDAVVGTFTLVVHDGDLTLVDCSAISGNMGYTTAEVLSCVLLYDIHTDWVTMSILRNAEAHRRWLPFILHHLHTEEHRECRSVLADVLRSFLVEQRLIPITPCSLPLLLLLMHIADGRRRLPGSMSLLVWDSIQPLGPLMSRHHARLLDLFGTANEPKQPTSQTLMVIHNDDLEATSYRAEILRVLQDGGVVAVVGFHDQPHTLTDWVIATLHHTMCKNHLDGTEVCITFIVHLLRRSGGSPFIEAPLQSPLSAS